MTDEERRYLTTHDAHDFAALRQRWAALIQPCSLTEFTLSDKGGFPVLAYRSRALEEAGDQSVPGALYLCAGVHGDEPAGVWGLLEWAEANVALLCERAVLILPCFNPWGLVNNRRSDAEGRDLNRIFHLTDLPLMAAWRELMGSTQFELALLLHEDYDARGTYLYELTAPELNLGEIGLTACEAILPRDQSLEIEGVPFENGILRRTEGMEQVVEEELDGGYPEAIYLFIHHARSALTFETPSEFSLWHRVRAQRCFVETVLS